ncbi:MAG: nicotinate phosphoribosyltransferase [Deltaproteobacteria bacterium]|nr:MAG: nicotinate phosphoribosyltransferase [Deltaproteobacteria bacterium]
MVIPEPLGLYTDLYQLRMAEGYVRCGRHHERAVFDYFFRKPPFGGEVVVAAGLRSLAELLPAFRFGPEAIAWLAEKGAHPDFIAWLREYRFGATVRSVREGEVVFANEPVLSVEATLPEAQLIETLILNVLNYSSLVATRAARLVQAARGRPVVDFGMRRAPGWGALQASEAAAVGGVEATSNVLAAFHGRLPLTGTQAHSWILSFGDELRAFRTYAEQFPDDCVLLVDTYDTLRSGVPNAITVAREMLGRGQRLRAIRLDSGDLAFLSRHARAMLDEAGLAEVRIVASNSLDERIIRSLLEQDAPIDAFGVGTDLVTGRPDAALDGVYKLARVGRRPCLKRSENVEKVNLPGRKNVIRVLAPDGSFLLDGVLHEDEDVATVDRLLHPYLPGKETPIAGLVREEILSTMLSGGARVRGAEGIAVAADRARERLARVPPEHRRFEFPHRYRVGLGPGLHGLRARLLKEVDEGLDRAPRTPTGQEVT